MSIGTHHPRIICDGTFRKGTNRKLSWVVVLSAPATAQLQASRGYKSNLGSLPHICLVAVKEYSSNVILHYLADVVEVIESEVRPRH